MRHGYPTKRSYPTREAADRAALALVTPTTTARAVRLGEEWRVWIETGTPSPVTEEQQEEQP